MFHEYVKKIFFLAIAQLVPRVFIEKLLSLQTADSKHLAALLSVIFMATSYYFLHFFIKTHFFINLIIYTTFAYNLATAIYHTP